MAPFPMATLVLLLWGIFFVTFFTATETLPFEPKPIFVALFISNSFSAFFNSLVVSYFSRSVKLAFICRLKKVSVVVGENSTKLW